MKSLSPVAKTILFFCLLVSSAANAAKLPPGFTPVSVPELQFRNILQVKVAKEPIYLVLIEKSRQHLWVLKDDGHFSVVADFPSATGENPGLKMISGDARTPEGIYFITHEYKDNKITIFGDRAFHLDYPNIFDSDAGRSGNGIFIHGTNKELLPNSTNGCITLKNPDLDNLEEYLNLRSTPVVVVNSLNDIDITGKNLLTSTDFDQVSKHLFTDDINQTQIDFDQLYFINIGSQAVLVGEFNHHPYDFSMQRGSGRSYLFYQDGAGWMLRKRLLRINPLQIYAGQPLKLSAMVSDQEPLEFIEISEDLSPQPEYVPPAPRPEPLPLPSPAARPDIAALTNPTPAAPAKSLTIPTTPPLPAPVQLAALVDLPEAPTVKPPPVASKQDLDREADRREVVDFIENWRAAWESKKLEPYIASYDATFTQGNKDLAAWRDHKEKLNKEYRFIKVAVSDITINWTKTGAIVSFNQEYQSDRYRAKGRKTLHLRLRDTGWRITQELWQKG